MNKKERTELAINLSILLDPILSNDHNPEDVANVAIDFCKYILKDFPEISDIVEQIYENYDSEDIGFQRKWDKHMAFLRILKSL